MGVVVAGRGQVLRGHLGVLAALGALAALAAPVELE